MSRDYEDSVNVGVFKMVAAIYSQAETDLNFDPTDEELVEMVESIRGEARAWLDDDSEKWGSFRHLCMVLGRNPRAERTRLRKALTNRGEKT